MRITHLKTKPGIYSCNAYLIRGNNNALSDVNTLVDVGTDSFVIEEIKTIYTGAGKSPVEQIVLTHNHFDHSGDIAEVIKEFHIRNIAAYHCEEVNLKLNNGDRIIMGDEEFEVFHVPGHSSDSICLLNAKHGVLFSGDTHFDIDLYNGNYEPEFIEAIERLVRFKLSIIYPGHGQIIIRKDIDCIRKLVKLKKLQYVKIKI